MALACWVTIPLALQYAQTHLQSSHVIGTQACPPRDRLGHIPTRYCDTFSSMQASGVLVAYALLSAV